MKARNKLKTIDLMRIDTHIVYHAQRIITEFLYRFSFKGGGVVSLKTDGSWGSKGSCHSPPPLKLNLNGNYPYYPKYTVCFRVPPTYLAIIV